MRGRGKTGEIDIYVASSKYGRVQNYIVLHSQHLIICYLLSHFFLVYWFSVLIFFSSLICTSTLPVHTKIVLSSLAFLDTKGSMFSHSQFFFSSQKSITIKLHIFIYSNTAAKYYICYSSKSFNRVTPNLYQCN